MIRLAIIGLLIITSLSLIFGSCSPKEIEVNIDTFDGNMSKALKSKIIVVKDKIHLIDLGSPFDGKIYLTENSKTVQELEIVKGEIINAKLFDKDGLNIGNYHKIDESLIFETNTDSLVSECNWSEFTNASFINGTLEDEEHTCSIKIKTENTNLTVLLSVKYDKLNKLIINETTGQDKNINKIIFKNIAYKRNSK
jgi:hypothetical protein